MRIGSAQAPNGGCAGVSTPLTTLILNDQEPLDQQEAIFWCDSDAAMFRMGGRDWVKTTVRSVAQPSKIADQVTNCADAVAGPEVGEDKGAGAPHSFGITLHH